MKYVITGSAGNISKPLAETLLQAGHQVTVISRTAANLKSLTDAGATAAIGSVEDEDFLAETFKGADAVYTMVPPKWDPIDWKKHIGQTGERYARIISKAGVKYVVNLSSVGAHLPNGCVLVSGLYISEQALNTLKDVNVKHLRPAYFYQNLLSNLPLIKSSGIMGGISAFQLIPSRSQIPGTLPQRPPKNYWLYPLPGRVYAISLVMKYLPMR